MDDALFSVENKKVLLTGAAGGLGQTFLRAFVQRGATVYAVVRRRPEAWDTLKYGEKISVEYCDLSRNDDVRRIAEKIEEKSGGIDVLINNASDCPHLKEDVYSLDVLQKTLSVTLEAAYILCGYFAQAMAIRGYGSIINITTMNSEKAWPGNPAYITAKSALRMLTLAVARDFGERGVRANNLCPGYVHTRLTHETYTNPLLHEERRSHTMLGRWGEAEDMVGPCIFLASDASRYITGADLHVDGGWLAKGM